jgi:hypothetical protein
LTAQNGHPPEAANLADAESRVRSEESGTGTTVLPAVDANPQLDCVGSWANAAEVIAAPFNEIAACHDQSVCRAVSNVLHELAIDGIAGPAARRSWPR